MSKRKKNQQVKKITKNKHKQKKNMTNNAIVNTKEVITINEKPTIIISKDLSAKIAYLHNKYPGKEWSGPLIYQVISGDIRNPRDLKIKCLDIHILDVGSSTYTSSEVNKNPEFLAEMWDKHPNLGEEGVKMGYCHTHHNMAAYFSGTDQDELHTNVVNYPYYLSLIVNHACKPVAKIAISGIKKFSVTENHIEYKSDPENSEFERINLQLPAVNKPVVLEIECQIEFELDEEEKSYINRVEEASKPVYNYAAQQHNSYNGNGWKDGIYVGYGNNYSENKKGETFFEKYSIRADFIHRIILNLVYKADSKAKLLAYRYKDTLVNKLSDYNKWFKNSNNEQKLEETRKFIDNFEKIVDLVFQDDYEHFVFPGLKKLQSKDFKKICEEITKWTYTYENAMPELFNHLRTLTIKLANFYNTEIQAGSQEKIEFERSGSKLDTNLDEVY